MVCVAGGDGEDGAAGGGSAGRPKRPPPPNTLPAEWRTTIEIAQLLLSLLHGWSLDEDLDQVCRNRLGLCKPRSSVSYGLLSRSGTSRQGIQFFRDIINIENIGNYLNY